MPTSSRLARTRALVLSCEHGGNYVPARYRACFRPPATVLASHRGYDPGSAELGARLAEALGAPLVRNEVTRLLLDANRGADNPTRASRWTLALPPALFARAERDVWRRHRDAVAGAVASARRRGPVTHVSVHTFTPRLRGVRRHIDVAWLFDPARPSERQLVARWMAAFRRLEPRLRLARNRPYRGTDDGLTTTLRARFRDAAYAGIELEVSQRFPRGRTAVAVERWRRLQDHLAQSLEVALERPGLTRRRPT